MLPVADTSYPVNRITPAVLSGPRLHTIHCRDIYGLRVLRPEDTPLRWNDSYTPHKPDSLRHKKYGKSVRCSVETSKSLHRPTSARTYGIGFLRVQSTNLFVGGDSAIPIRFPYPPPLVPVGEPEIAAQSDAVCFVPLSSCNPIKNQSQGQTSL